MIVEERTCQCGCRQPLPQYADNRVSHLIGHQRRKQLSVTIDERTECWNWDFGSSHNGGYILITIDKQCVLAHRWTYEHFIGPIPEGLDLDHTCRNRMCVNPWHLEAVTNQVNVQRGKQSKLTPELVKNMRIDKQTMTYQQLADRYGLTSRQYAQKVVAGLAWGNVE